MAVTVLKVTVMTIVMVTNDGSDSGRDGEDSGGDGGNQDGSDDGDEAPRGQKSLFTDACPALRMEPDTTCPLH